jgi:membrane protease subunit (stomatin/prohibitin family)
MRGFIVARFTDTLGDVLETILDLGRVYDELGIATRERCREDFDKFGIELVDLLIEAITPPEEVQKMIDERTSMEAVGDMGRFTQFRTAQAIGDMAKQPGAGGGGMELGAGLGAGIGLGQAMAGAMASAQQQAQQPAAPAAAAMVKCPKCGEGAPVGAKFCPGCGEKVPAAAHCTECGAEVPAGAKFCPGCGKQQGG